MCNNVAKSLTVLAAIGVVATISSAGGGPQFSITGESRQILGTTSAGAAGQPFVSDVESAVAGDLDPFDESVDALAGVRVVGGTAFASAEAAQASSLSSSVLAASGSFMSVAGTPSGGSVFTETFNTYSAHFQVDASGPVLLNLHGNMIGGLDTSFQRAIVRVFLIKAGQTVFSATTESFAPETMVELDELIETEPGAYILQIFGTSAVSDLPGPTDTLPKTVMQGGFNISLGFAAPSPDLNGDGIVNGTDLALLLSAWGSCSIGALCEADFTADGIVNGEDLAFLLAAWGPVGN